MATVRKRGNSYQIRAYAGYDGQGKQIEKVMSWTPAPGMTEKQIQKELERQKVMFENQVKSGQYTDGNIKFQEFAEQWFQDYGKDHLRERTYQRYKELAIRTYAAIGHIPLHKLQPQHLLRFYQQLAESGQNQRTGGGLSQKTIKHYHTFISSVLERAVKWQIIPANPCKRIDAPKVIRKEAKYLDEEQAAYFLSRLPEEPIDYQVMFTLLLITGMRRGELLGLEWQDIDLEQGTIQICRTSQYNSARGIYTDTTKTEQSKRLLSIPREICQLLIDYRSWQNNRRLQLGDQWDRNWTKAPRLFCQWDGKPMHPNTPYQELQKFMQRIDMEPIPLHSLRHTNASLLIGAGTDLRTVSGRLGHSQTSTTLNVYAHLLRNKDEAASEMIANKLLRHG